MRKRTYIIGSIAIILFIGGAILKQIHSAGAGVGIISGLLLFALGFCPSFIYDKWTIEPSRESRRSYLVLLLAIELIVFGSILTILRLPGSPITGYLSILVFSVYLVFFTRHSEGRLLKLHRSRQLACTLFTDIVGFTEMMGESEENAISVLERNRAIQKKYLRKYRGRLIKELGDGTLTVFYTAFEALQFALNVQQEIKSEDQYATRMGMHIAEILFTDSDIFGDGVNVASRIASLAGPSEICFSQGVFQNIKNKQELNVKSMGTKELKGVDYTLDIYSITI